MKSTILLAALAILSFGAAADDAKVSLVGDYVEARSCDVWTGPCFSNSEYGITGNQAVVAWSVEKGSWNGARLDGLKVAAVLRAEGTLHTDRQGKVKAAVYVDRNATPEQADALLAAARSLAPQHLGDVVRVHRADISLKRDGKDAVLAVGDEVRVSTACLSCGDCICGNEEKAYPAISASADVECVKTLEHTYSGSDLGAKWSTFNKRSSMVGRFAR